MKIKPGTGIFYFSHGEAHMSCCHVANFLRHLRVECHWDERVVSKHETNLSYFLEFLKRDAEESVEKLLQLVINATKAVHDCFRMWMEEKFNIVEAKSAARSVDVFYDYLKRQKIREVA